MLHLNGLSFLLFGFRDHIFLALGRLSYTPTNLIPISQGYPFSRNLLQFFLIFDSLSKVSSFIRVKLISDLYLEGQNNYILEKIGMAFYSNINKVED